MGRGSVVNAYRREGAGFARHGLSGAGFVAAFALIGSAAEAAPQSGYPYYTPYYSPYQPQIYAAPAEPEIVIRRARKKPRCE